MPNPAHGQMEVVNSSLITYLTQVVDEYGGNMHEWPLMLPIVEHIMNNRPSPARCGYTPNELR